MVRLLVRTELNQEDLGMTDGDTIKAVLTRTKDSKRMHRYDLVIPHRMKYADVFANIYIHKDKFKGQEVPEEIQVTITPVWK